MNQTNVRKYLPYGAVVLTLLYFGYSMLPARDRQGDFAFTQFGRILAINNGRHQPLDTVARIDLMIITHRQQFYNPDTEKTIPATQWLLDCYTTPLPGNKAMIKLFPDGFQKMAAWDLKMFRIENDVVMNQMELPRRDGLRYSLRELGSNIPKLMHEARRVKGDEMRGIKGVDPKQMTIEDAKWLELDQHLQLFQRIVGHDSPLLVPNNDGSDQWMTFADAHYLYDEAYRNKKLPDTLNAQCYAMLRDIFKAYEQGDKSEFNRLVATYVADQETRYPQQMQQARVETFFNNFAPFYRSLVVYVLIALAAALSWLFPEWTGPVLRGAYLAMATAVVFHLSGLLGRMYIQDRLFVWVTNLYTSAVFIGLGAVVVCLIIEPFYKNGIATVVGSVTGFATLIIAHMLSLSGDTLEMMQAVLDTNFWLATHVTIITLGYTAAFVAGGMGITYILLGFFTEKLRGEGSANLARMTYGVLCAGMFLSFVGTVLGGLWADYSWGRFWGWDPKENGALLIVIWIALILHARWGGMVKHRGIAVLSVLGIIVTSWSWFGTNFLGVGLHSYGFRQGAMATLILIDLGFLAIAGLGMIPLENWQSFRAPSSTENAKTPGQPQLV